MTTESHYEFDDINELSDIIFKVSLPKVHNAIWKSHAGFFFLDKVTIKVSVENMVIDDRDIDPSKRLIHNGLLQNQVHQMTGNPTIFYIPLLLQSVEKEFAYLFNPDNKHLQYKVTCDIKINEKPKLILLYNIPDKNITPTIEGEFLVEKINKKLVENKLDRITIHI